LTHDLSRRVAGRLTPSSLSPERTPMSPTTTLTKDPAEALQGHCLYIDGRRVSATSGGRHRHVNPATGKVQAEVALAGPAEIDRAVQSARAARATWRAVPPLEKVRILMRCADMLAAASDEIGLLVSLETGQPYKPGPGAG